MRLEDVTLSKMLSATRLTPAEAFKACVVVVAWLRKIASDSGLSEAELAEQVFPWHKDRIDRLRRFLDNADPNWFEVKAFLRATKTSLGKLFNLVQK